MKKLIIFILALMLTTACAFAEGSVPYFEEHGVKVCNMDEIYGIRLNDGFVFFDDTTISAYPCDIEYVIVSDEVAEGKRHLNIKMDVGLYELPAVSAGSTMCVFYALYDYYTGYQFYVEADMENTDIEMKDFTVEYGGEVYEISARVANTYVDYDGARLVFVFEYEIIMDEDYDGLLLCNAPVYDYVDYADFKSQMDENGDSGLPLIEDLGDLAYKCIYVRVR